MTVKNVERWRVCQRDGRTLLSAWCWVPDPATIPRWQTPLGWGSATFVLVCSNVIISLLRKIIPDEVRIPCYIVVVATFVTIVDKVMAAGAPGLHQVLGIFIPLIVVNCIILGRAEAFASKNTIGRAFLDGLGMGLGFTLALSILSVIREPLGEGTFLVAEDFGFEGIRVISEDKQALMFILPPGAFITLGLVLAGINKLAAKFFPGEERRR